MKARHLFLAFAALVLLVGIAAASTPVNANVNAGPQEKYQGGAASPGSVTTEGGNVTEVNVTIQNVSTERWAGFYGNISGGSLVLADSSGAAMYAWSVNIDGYLDYVYAALTNTVTWSTLAAGSWSGGEQEYNWVVGTPAYTDDYTNTFTNTGGATFADVSLSGVPYAMTYDNNGNGAFPTYHLQDSDNTREIWAANVTAGSTGFNGATLQYQLIVPANPAPGATVTYYFYLELN